MFLFAFIFFFFLVIYSPQITNYRPTSSTAAHLLSFSYAQFHTYPDSFPGVISSASPSILLLSPLSPSLSFSLSPFMFLSYLVILFGDHHTPFSYSYPLSNSLQKTSSPSLKRHMHPSA